jgi:hypothetical protein
MDSIRFDTLTKALTSRGGRRTVLRRIAGGAGVALTGAPRPIMGRVARGQPDWAAALSRQPRRLRRPADRPQALRSLWQ